MNCRAVTSDDDDDDDVIRLKVKLLPLQNEKQRILFLVIKHFVMYVYISVFPNLGHIRPTASMEDQRKAAMELIIRVLGPRSSSFIILIIENKDPEFREKFNVSTSYFYT